jgi:hypothetical protein
MRESPQARNEKFKNLPGIKKMGASERLSRLFRSAQGCPAYAVEMEFPCPYKVHERMTWDGPRPSNKGMT